jgi:hypothetical protein
VPPEVYDGRWRGLEAETKVALERFAKPVDSEEVSGCEVEQQLGTLLGAGEELENTHDLATRYVTGDPAQLNQLIHTMVDSKGAFQDLIENSELFDKNRKNFEDDVDAFNEDIYSCNDNLQNSMTVCARLDQRRVKLEARKKTLEDQDEQLTNTREKLNSFARDGSKLSGLLVVSGNCSSAWRSVRDANVGPKSGFVKTPSLVVSTDLKGVAIGGHNLDGRSIRIVADDRIPVGSAKVDSSGDLIQLNSADLPKAKTAAREFERRRRAYVNGDDDTRQLVVDDVETALRADTRTSATPFSPAALGRAEQTSVGRGVGSVREPTRFAATDPTTLSALQLKAAVELGTQGKADFVVGVRDGVYSVVDIRPPPSGLGFPSPIDFQRTIEKIVAQEAGRSDNKGLAILSDGSLSANELDGVKITSETRQIVAEASGGGAEPPSNTGHLGVFADEPGGRKWLKVWPLTRDTVFFLRRTDADWPKAKVLETSIHVGNGQGIVVAKLEIPFKADPSSLILRVVALFKKKIPSNADAEHLSNVLKASAATSQEISVEDKLQAIREAYTSSVKDDASLRFNLIHEKLDFFIVRDWSNDSFHSAG